MKPIYATKLIDPDSLKESIFYLFRKAAETKGLRNNRLRIKRIHVTKYTDPSVRFNANITYDYKGRQLFLTLRDVPDSQIIPEDYWVTKSPSYRGETYLDELVSTLVDESEIVEKVNAWYDFFRNAVTESSNRQVNRLNYKFKLVDDATDYGTTDSYVDFIAMPDSIDNPEFVFESFGFDDGCDWVLTDTVTGYRFEGQYGRDFSICETYYFDHDYTADNIKNDVSWYITQDCEYIDKYIKMMLFYRTLDGDAIINNLTSYFENYDEFISVQFSFDDDNVLDEVVKGDLTRIEDIDVTYILTFNDGIANDITSRKYSRNLFYNDLDEIIEDVKDRISELNRDIQSKRAKLEEMELKKSNKSNKPQLNIGELPEEEKRRLAYKEKYKKTKNKYEPTIYEDDSFDWDDEGNLI